ncbi:MAG: argininosuccinate lyase [Bacteroidota bacterium]
MKLWGCRFESETAADLAGFQNSLSFDQRLWRQDIRASIAHARMLGNQGIIPPEDAEKIILGLESIAVDLETGRLAFPAGEAAVQLEDVHTAIEGWLVERIGEAGKRLHTARSRNDQVQVDTRLFLKDAIAGPDGVDAAVVGLQRVLVQVAERDGELLMPGYTHLQRAQPILLGHHLLAYFWMLQRDRERLADCLRRADACPLGSGALAGVPYPVDREAVARELGFARITENSLDTVADRDYLIEALADLAIIMMHLSRLAEELVLWSSAEFGFVELADAYATGSSIMPQKKNPDGAELIRGKSGRVFGQLVALLAVCKGLPLAYNKDLQEDKEALFDGLDTVRGSLRVMASMLATSRFRGERMEAAARDGFLNATDLADYLVRRGVPFRQAHGIVGQLVRYCLEKGCRLEELSRDELARFAPEGAVAEDVYAALDLRNVIAARKSPGATGDEPFRQQLAAARRLLEDKAGG